MARSKQVPAAATANIRNDMYLASDAVRADGCEARPGFDSIDATTLKTLREVAR